MVQNFTKISKEEELSKADRVFGKNALDGVEGVIDLVETTNENTAENKTDFEEQLNESLTKKLPSRAKEIATKSRKRDLEEYEEFKATRENLFKRLEETTPLRIITNERKKEIQIFEARRLTEFEQSKLLDRDLAAQLKGRDFEEYSEEEVESLTEQNSKLLEKVIADPKLTQKEWKERVDGAMTRQLATEAMNFLNNVDESEVLKKFKKK